MNTWNTASSQQISCYYLVALLHYACLAENALCPLLISGLSSVDQNTSSCLVAHRLSEAAIVCARFQMYTAHIWRKAEHNSLDCTDDYYSPIGLCPLGSYGCFNS